MVVVHPAEKLSFSNEKARDAHERRYRNYRAASNVWSQLSVEDRAYVLGKAGYREDIDEAAYDDSLGSIRATGAQRDRIINAIRFAPRDPRFAVRYKAERSNRPADIRVRKHERQLREKGLRRPVMSQEREVANVPAASPR